MPLVNPLHFIKKAHEKGVAIPAFNIHNMETIQAVLEAAAEERTPVIIQTTPGTLEHAGIPYIAANVKTGSELYDIPVALHLDHCSSYETIMQCIRQGYTSVMVDGSELPYDDNVKLVCEVVKVAHAVGVNVEGEIGRIGGTEDDMTVDEKEATLTVPQEAKTFAESTGIDIMAIAIGTAHGEYLGEAKLDFERLADINKITTTPLVLHGASGVPDDSIRRAIDEGICKINIATELKIPMANSIKKCFADNPEENDPRKYMGLAKEAVKQVVREKIRLCGSNNLMDEI